MTAFELLEGAIASIVRARVLEARTLFAFKFATFINNVSCTRRQLALLSPELAPSFTCSTTGALYGALALV